MNTEEATAIVVNELRLIMVPDAIEPWLVRRIPAFGGRTPRDLIEAGEVETVLAPIDAIAAGVFL